MATHCVNCARPITHSAAAAARRLPRPAAISGELLQRLLAGELAAHLPRRVPADPLGLARVELRVGAVGIALDVGYSRAGGRDADGRRWPTAERPFWSMQWEHQYAPNMRRPSP